MKRINVVRFYKSRLETIPVAWKNLDEAIRSATKMINDHEQFLIDVKRNGSGQGLGAIRSEYKSLEVNLLVRYKTSIRVTLNFSSRISNEPLMTMERRFNRSPKIIHKFFEFIQSLIIVVMFARKFNRSTIDGIHLFQMFKKH